MLPQKITVSVSALRRMCRAHNLGEPHVMLRGPAVFLDADTEREADQATWAEFANRGLVDRRGRLDEDVLDSLSCLVRPSVEYLGCFTVRRRWCHALVAGGSREAVVAVRDRDRIALHSVRGESLVHTLMRQLPDLPIRYADYRSGRVLITITGGYASLAPATKTLLAERLAEAHQRLVTSSS